MAAEACPDRPALTHDGTHYSYAQLFNAAKHAAQTFEAAGCKYVSLLDVSSPAVPVALMGAAMAGIPYVPLNYRLSEEQIVPVFDRISPAYLISGQREDNYDFEGWVVQDSSDFLSENSRMRQEGQSTSSDTRHRCRGGAGGTTRGGRQILDS